MWQLFKYRLTPNSASYRNLSAIQDREICCYSISCKEKDNIGKKGWVFLGERVTPEGASNGISVYCPLLCKWPPFQRTAAQEERGAIPVAAVSSESVLRCERSSCSRHTGSASGGPLSGNFHRTGAPLWSLAQWHSGNKTLRMGPKHGFH